ncbi:MAG: tRNA pseudouridine(55) synthase TruB [Thermodesulfobacteriota bacterium]|nr:tRNA pseudouridine(55) synthase TruB [Thermodesulfobacteriota bacterium]
MEYPIDGILLVDKDEGETSYGVVRKAKSVFRELNVRKVGHAGTLDPFATGLLIILLGQGTKLSHFIMSEDKVYTATLRLGIETDTLDPTGRQVRTNDVPDLSPGYIQEKARKFIGHIEQIPPLYSAVKHKGKRAYSLARRGLKPHLNKRKVTVGSVHILSVNLPDVTMEVRCSSGTYVRSLAAALGNELGPGGHLKSLRRLASGSFEARSAVSSKEILAKGNRTSLLDRVIPLRDAVPGMREIEIDAFLAEKVRNGLQSALEGLTGMFDFPDIVDEHVKLVEDGRLVAIVKLIKTRRPGYIKTKIERVFM